MVRNTIRKRVKRNGNYFDYRTHEGQQAMQLQAQLLDDQGGMQGITAARYIAIRELCQANYFQSMIDKSIYEFLKENPQGRNAKMLARLFSYRGPVSNTIAHYIDLLGLEKRMAPAKALDEIIAEDEGENNTGSEE
jgi:hypothetical protein